MAPQVSPTLMISQASKVSILNQILVDYKDYIKNFEWNTRKYNQKMPLSELCGAFVKTLSNQDTLLKKH